MKRLLLILVVAIVAFVALFAAWGYAPDADPQALRRRYVTPADRFVRLEPGLTVRVRDEGPRAAPAILLLHGSSSSLEDWDGWARVLTPRYRVVRYDQPGHGLTGPDPQDRYSMADLARVAGEVADRMGLKRFVLGGNSMGGNVAWTYAAEHSERLTGLILVDAAGAPGNAPDSVPLGFRLANSPLAAPLVRWVTPRALVRGSVEDTFGDPAKVTPALVDRYRDMLLTPGNRAATLVRTRVPRRPASAQRMAAITVPTLLLWGGRDRLVPLKGGTWFDQALPNSRLVVLPDAGHIPMVEDPRASVAPVLDFLARLAPPEPSPATDGGAFMAPRIVAPAR